MTKLTLHDYVSLLIYIVTVLFNFWMFSLGLYHPVFSVVGNSLWLIIWGLMFAYSVSIIGRAMDKIDIPKKVYVCPICGQEVRGG